MNYEEERDLSLSDEAGASGEANISDEAGAPGESNISDELNSAAEISAGADIDADIKSAAEKDERKEVKIKRGEKRGSLHKTEDKPCLVEVRGLSKVYGKIEAVKDLSMRLEPGNIYGFLGPNGAGKTTTMNIITGYIGATTGEVLIDGHDINKEPELAKKCIGYLPEQPPIYGEMRVIEYLNFAADLKGIAKETLKSEVQRAMEQTHLQPMRDRLIRNLSKGYKQRVGLAQALIGMPKVIILDEPTVGLDPKQIIEVRSLIKSLRKKHTVILSSHILQEISAVCDHVFIISKGRLVAGDSLENLEDKMSGTQQLMVTVRGNHYDAEKMAAISGVKRVEPLGTESESESTVLLYASEGEDVREAVFSYCVQNHLPLLELKISSKTLEDVFLELTGAREVSA